MKTRIVRIGNSQGIRIPKSLLEQSRLTGEVELFAREGMVVVRAIDHPRARWADAFSTMAKRGDDRLRDVPSSTSTWDDGEWTW
jgi:antitoxin MazE